VIGHRYSTAGGKTVNIRVESVKRPGVTRFAPGTMIAVIRNTKKKDDAPRGVFRHESGLWAIRFTCGAGHIHEERVGTVKSEAIQRHHARRGRALAEPG